MNEICSSFEMIDFYKYLNCDECRESGLYCTEHREEVTQILESKDQ